MKNQNYDLDERTAIFGERVIRLCYKIKKSPITNPLITQLIKCSTSVGANYCEADNAESKEDFHHKIGICKKEAQESKHFLRMIAVAEPEIETDSQELLQEASELNLIFNTIYSKTKNNKN